MRWLWIMALAISSAHAEDLLPDERRAKKQDALYGEALYALHAGEYDRALSLNQSLRKRGVRGYGKVLNIHEATAQLGLGMSQTAKKQFHKLISDERISFLPPKARAQSWFYLAKHFYEKGLWKSALQAIRKIQPQHVTATLKDEYHFLAATLELFKGNHKKADKHLLAIQPNSEWATYGFLNLAVSYAERDVLIGKVEQVFNRALQLTKNTPHPEALADKINLMAGQFFYATGRGRSAIKHLKNVGLDGAYTPKALLTYGWALTEQWQYHDALQPWYMLKTAHSQLNQDVQETLIAIPHLLEKLNAKVMALGAFDYAVEQFDEVYQQLDASAKRLNTGKFIEPLLAQQIPDRWGAFTPIDLSLPDHPDQVYLKDVMSQGYFQGELRSLRDVHVMRYKLKEAIDQLEAFRSTTETRREEYTEVQKQGLVSKHSRHLADLKKRYSKLKARITKAFGSPDGTGLASEGEKEQLSAFSSTKKQIKKLAKQEDISPEHYAQRLRRVEGVLKWELSERFIERKKHVARNLAILEDQIARTTKQLSAAKFAYQTAPKSYLGYDKKIAKLKKKYQKQLTKLDVVYQKQRERVGSIVKADIKQRQQRVMEYQLQARLAAARLFDETSNKKRTVATGEVRQ